MNRVPAWLLFVLPMLTMLAFLVLALPVLRLWQAGPAREPAGSA